MGLLFCVCVCVEIVTGLKFSSDCRHLITVSGDRCVYDITGPSDDITGHVTRVCVHVFI